MCKNRGTACIRRKCRYFSITGADIFSRFAAVLYTRRVTADTSKWLQTLAGDRPFDDLKFFCYSKYQEEPEYSQCMRTFR